MGPTGWHQNQISRFLIIIIIMMMMMMMMMMMVMVFSDRRRIRGTHVFKITNGAR